MSRRTLERLEALESQATAEDSDDPSRIYRVMTGLELEAPEPMPGETTKEWLTRVPRASLRVLVKFGDASHGKYCQKDGCQCGRAHKEDMIKFGFMKREL